ncbi:uncharacterized protein LOC118756221 [Rhagoletis pomonella]|nr:uncharacterized protein LOC118756221 [Rhagoletis pomonella]
MDVRNAHQNIHVDFVKKRHHSLLHNISETISSPSTPPNNSFTTNESASVHTTSVETQLGASAQGGQVILATALILVRDACGEFEICRVLLDSCSQVNLMTQALCSGLNLRKSRNNIDVCGIGSSPLKIAFKMQTTIRSRINNFETSLEFLISPQISGYHPSETVASADLMIPRNINLADPEFHRSRGVDMLLGAEASFSLLSVGNIRLGDNLPTLQKTLFGWIVSGKCSAPRQPISNPSHCAAISTIDNINRNVEKLWQLEEVNSKRQHLTSEEYQCETHFLKTVTKSNGRLMVKLLFKGDVRSLGNSRDIAMRRFLAMENKLEKNPTLKSEYTEFLKEYEELGHMS